MAVYTGNRPSCSNCGLYGHHNRSCYQPISSYGIIAFRQQAPTETHAQTLAKTVGNGLRQDTLEFLMIQRRNSIGFIELIRAKYKLQDLDYIRQQIQGTTVKERDMLLTYSFEKLWKELWGADSENRHYRNDFLQAKQKFEQLISGYQVGNTYITLAKLLESEPVKWSTPEWEFPKGRRNLYETDELCAKREFHEETGLAYSQFHLLDSLEPIRETFYGNNNIHYAHIYYLAWVDSNTRVEFQLDNEEMVKEIGGLTWVSYADALTLIRSDNQEKRHILQRAYTILRTVCPILRATIIDP